jgi:hypothetical protein
MSSYPLRRSAKTLRDLVRRVHKRAFGPTPRATKDYATHVPVLVGLAQKFKIIRVLELGCGNYSSVAFLDLNIFPCLTHLTSLETDELWLESVTKKLTGDTRFHPIFLGTSIADGLEKVDLEEFDLVFVDDSITAEDRRRTIETIYNKKPDRPFIVIHDFEVNEYRLAAKGFESRYIFKGFTPQTGIVWNGTRKNSSLKKIDQTIKQFCGQLEPDDLIEWKSAFEKQ